MTPVVREYGIPVPIKGVYREIMNTDSREYGGSGVVNEGEISSLSAWELLDLGLPPVNDEYFIGHQYIPITFPPLAMTMYEYCGNRNTPEVGKQALRRAS